MNIEEMIKNKNLRLTVARTELLEMLLKQSKPICYEDIKEYMTMDKATFYRNISRFEEEEIVHSFEANDKKRYFEIKIDKHPHFMCNYCHKIECITDPHTPLLEGYIVESVMFKGRCSACQ